MTQLLASHPQTAPERGHQRATTTPAEAEATSIALAAAVIAAVLVVTAGTFAFLGMLQISGVALFGALAASIASVAGRPSRGYRWIGPAIIGVAMVTVIVASLWG